MNQRLERIASEIREILGEAIVRGEIKDPRVREAGLVTVTHVRVTGDLREAHASFIVHDADEAKLELARQGLNSASGYLRRLIGRQLRLKVTPTLTFEIDRVFDQEAKIDRLLHEIETEKK
ncbi:MAG TPA: 30S ribosome-binding factor RbfA [Polyangia bacterium]|nr:30S ribosome-binding factor RbfA [Polyangia bacterium]